MITITTPARRPSRARRLMGTALFSGAFALVVSPLAGVAMANADYKESDFAACLERNMPTDYCCEHAGGVMRSGACIDPQDLLQQVDPQPTGPTGPPVSTIPTGGVLEPVDTPTTPKRPTLNVPVTTAIAE